MKFVSLMSSGIDSPVATYLFSKRGEDIVLVHADNRPYTDDREMKNFIDIAHHIKNKTSDVLKAFVVPHGHSLSMFKQRCNNRFTCVFCKRMLLRYAEKIAKKEQADTIIMGDSLGQVASQTLQNIRVIEQAIDIPVLRPLIGYDKEDIVQIAKEIGTYDISIKPSEGCVAVPCKPATRARLEDVLAEEKKIDIDKLVSQAVDKTELISL